MEPYSQQDHDKAVEEGMRGILLFGGIVIGVTLIIIFG